MQPVLPSVRFRSSGYLLDSGYHYMLWSGDGWGRVAFDHRLVRKTGSTATACWRSRKNSLPRRTSSTSPKATSWSFDPVLRARANQTAQSCCVKGPLCPALFRPNPRQLIRNFFRRKLEIHVASINGALRHVRVLCRFTLLNEGYAASGFNVSKGVRPV